jgi:uncharacterized membrane protein (DUF485 family)
VSPAPGNEPEVRAKLSRAPYVSGIVALVCYLAFIVLSFLRQGGWLNVLLRDHYVFFVGLPFAALVSHFLVGTLEIARGRIEFEALGIKFKGASGPIIMWVVVFLAIVTAFRLVWGLS